VEATHHLDLILAKGVKVPKPGKKTSWQNHPDNFVEVSANEFPAGVETFSAGWFGQAHAVCFLFAILTKTDS